MSHVLLFAYFLRGKKESLWNRELVFEHFFQELKHFFYSPTVYRAMRDIIMSSVQL